MCVPSVCMCVSVCRPGKIMLKICSILLLIPNVEPTFPFECTHYSIVALQPPEYSVSVTQHAKCDNSIFLSYNVRICNNHNYTAASLTCS